MKLNHSDVIRKIYTLNNFIGIIDFERGKKVINDFKEKHYKNEKLYNNINELQGTEMLLQNDKSIDLINQLIWDSEMTESALGKQHLSVR